MPDPLIYFVRHGETDWNVAMRFQGQLDVPINARGQKQADANGAVIREHAAGPERFDFVSSPLGRTRETMARVRTAMGLEPNAYRTDDRLMEVNYGDWEGHTLEEIERRFPELFEERLRDKWNFLPPGKNAESYAMLAKRIERWLQTVSGPMICATHGGVIRSVFHIAGGLTGKQAAEMTVPQDRVLALKGKTLSWL